MNRNENSLLNFIGNYKELRISFKEILFDKSFSTDGMKDNIVRITKQKYFIDRNLWILNDEKHSQFTSDLLILISDYAHEYGGDIEKITAHLAKEKKFSHELITDILSDNQKKISDLSRRLGISIDFITFFSLLLAFPYRESVAKQIQQHIDLRRHMSGFCPVCGHWPAMSYLVEKEGKKFMACLCCGSVWSFKRLKCSFCLTTDPDQLGFLNIQDDDTIAAYTCDSCRRYLKTGKIESAETDLPDEKLFLDYMSSGMVDIAALQNKYLQESMLGTRFDGPDDPKLDFYIKNY